MILWALHILERSRKPRCRSFSSRHDRARTYLPRHELSRHGARHLLTRSRKSINVWASFLRKLLAIAILDGQFRRDRTFVRHSFEVISIEKMSVQNCTSSEPVNQWPVHCGRRRGIAPERPGSQGMFAVPDHRRPEGLLTEPPK